MDIRSLLLPAYRLLHKVCGNKETELPVEPIESPINYVIDEDHPVYSVEILGESYIFRTLTRREYENITSTSGDDTLYFEELVCYKCTLEYPVSFTDFDTCLMGIPYTLAKAILDKSGYLSSEARVGLEQEALEWSKTLDARYTSLICFSFPTKTPSSLKDLSPREWFKYAAMSQLIVAGIWGVDTRQFLVPDVDAPTSAEELDMEQLQGLKQQFSQEGTFSFKN